MGRLRDWWVRVTGPATAATGTPRRQPGPSNTDQGCRPPGELTVADEPPTSKASRTGRAGFDPYSCDAGYTKPHSWERVDHD